MSWPLSQDYNEAIQEPRSSFADAELRTGEAVANALGIPMPRSGNFADVYEVRCPSGSRWAVKCFTREVHGLRERYTEISKYLRQVNVPFMVDFQYLEQGIRVRGQWFPVLKMQWVEGFVLNEFVRDNLDKKPILHALGQIWLRMARRLRGAKLAHGDLQHGNVMFVPSGSANALAVKLIDYDGMCVPALKGKPSGEVGHPAYQHPERLRSGTYNAEVDRFSLLSIAASLRCLAVGGRSLWERYDNGDNLLFRQTDLQAPNESPLFQELRSLGDPQAQQLVNDLYRACQTRLADVPLLTDLVAETKRASASRARITTAQAVAVAAQEPDWDFSEPEEEAPIVRPRRVKRGLPIWAWGALGGAAALLLSIGVAAGLFRRQAVTDTEGTPIVQQRPEAKTTKTATPLADAEPPLDQEREVTSPSRQSDRGAPDRTERFEGGSDAGYPPPFRISGALEGERLRIVGKSSDYPLGPQDMRRFAPEKWSGAKQLWAQPPKIGEWADLELPAPAKGRYAVVVHLTKARDYGIVRFHLAGKPLGGPIDCFEPEKVVNSGPINLGTVDLDQRPAILRVEAIGANPRSVGLRTMWGVDCIELKPATSPSAIVVNNPPPVVKPVPRRFANKIAVPNEPTLDDKRKQLRVMFRDDYKSMSKRALATQLLDQSRRQGDFALAYVMLSEAGEMATQEGDMATALRAASQLGSRFAVDPLDVKCRVLEQALSALPAKSKDKFRLLTQKALLFVDRAVIEEEFVYGDRLLEIAKTAAAKADLSGPLTRTVAQEANKFRAIREEFDPIKRHADMLETDPDNAEANLALGRYRCFVRRDWEGGLPLLAKGSDKALSELAQKDEESPGDPGERAALGDMWFDRAEKVKGKEQDGCRRRALYWYQECLENLDKKEQARVRGRLKKLVAQLPELSKPFHHLDLGAATISRKLALPVLRIQPQQHVATRQLYRSPIDIRVKAVLPTKTIRISFLNGGEVILRPENNSTRVLFYDPFGGDPEGQGAGPSSGVVNFKPADAPEIRIQVKANGWSLEVNGRLVVGASGGSRRAVFAPSPVRVWSDDGEVDLIALVVKPIR